MENKEENTQPLKPRSSVLADIILLITVIGGCITVVFASTTFKVQPIPQTPTPIIPTSTAKAIHTQPTATITSTIPPLLTPISTTCVPSPTSPAKGQIMDNGRTDYLDNIIWDFDWKECPRASLYEIYVIQEGTALPLIDITLSGSPYHYFNSGLYIENNHTLNWTWKVRAMIKGQWGKWSEPAKFNIEPVNTDPSPITKKSAAQYNYKLQDPYLGNCSNTPAGSVCIKFTDGYIWLIHDSVQGSSTGGKWNGKTVVVFHGLKADYYHVLGTSAVKEIPK